MSDLATNFEFPRMISDWQGYVSSRDRTNVAENIYVRGSQNVYKKLSGNLSVRPGQKRQGDADTTQSPVSSEFVWRTSWGATRTLWITNSKLQVNYNDAWYTLQEDLTETRYVFDKWWNETEQKDRALFVKGDHDMQHWSGGIAEIAARTFSSGVAVINGVPTAAGSGYIVGDILTINDGGTGATVEVLTLGNGVINSVSIVSGGTGYFVDNILNVPGVLNGGVPTTFRVTSVSGGVITGITLHTVGGEYSGDASNVSVPGGSGSFAVISYTVANDGVATVKTLTRGSGYTTGTGKTTTGGTGTGATLNITAIATGTITKTDTDVSWQQVGFTSTTAEKLIKINSSQYTYTGGEDTAILYGINIDPTVEPVGSIVLQAVITETDTPASTFNNDFIKVINNQVYVGSYTSRLVYISSNTDFTDYTVPSPRAAGDPELLTLDGTGKGIGVRQGKAHIGFGTGSWAVITFTDITVGSTLTQQTTVDVKPVALLQAPYAHEFIDTVGDSLVYLAQDQQVRTFGDFNNLFTPGYPSFSQEIATELMEQNFTGGALRCIGEFTYITAPTSGVVYLYQVRQTVDRDGNVVAERLWHSPFVWNVTRIDEIDGVTVGFSNANPQVYELWDTNQWHDDSPSDEPLPYSCVLAFSYRGEQRRQGLWSFDKNFTEGYVTPGTTLNLRINYNYQGFTNSIVGIINSTQQPAYLFSSTLASLGDNSLGDEPLGNGGITEIADDQDSLTKFKCINSLPIIDCFEYQPVLYSEEADSNWEILATATNAVIDQQQNATFIINKIRR